MLRSTLVMSLLALGAACGSSHPPGPSGPSPSGGGSGESGGSGGSPGTGGSGARPDAAMPGSGGAPMAGTGGASGGSGGTMVVPPDAAAGGAGGAPSSSEQPPCMKTTAVADSADLGGKLTAAQPGDCLELADGNYTFPVVTKTGTETAPVVIRAKNRGKAVVNSGGIHLVKSAYVVVEGLDITSPGAATTLYIGGSNGVIVLFSESHHCRLSRSRVHPVGPVAERDWIIVVGGAETHHNRIDHNDLGPVNANANMIVIDGSGREEPEMPGNVTQYNRIDHNHFHEVNNTGGNNWETLRIGRSWQGPTKGYNVIEHNLLVRTTGDPETISLKSSANIVRHNTMLNVNGEICSRHGNENQISGNYILGGSRGMRIYGGDHRIYNNYVASSSTGIWIESGASAAMNEPGKEHYRVFKTWVFNNTVVGQPIKLGGSKTYQPLDCRVANNVVVGAGIDNGGMGTVMEGNIAGGTSPLTMQDGLLRLLPNAAGAAAINKAVNSDFYMIKDDIQGQPRMAPDVGADEQSEAPVTIRGPLTPADVGPDSP